MTVAELIADLCKYSDNPNTRVVLDGYEGGLSEVYNVRALPIKLNVNRPDYFGPHDEPRWDQKADETAIYIARG